MSMTNLRHKVDGTQRVLHPAETLERVWPIARSLGVTRLADITGLDRVGIPTYGAIIPRSQDGISVANGKGLTAIEAKVGAVMEAIERQTACQKRLPMIEGSFQDLSRTRSVLDPRKCRSALRPDYDERQEYVWVRGEDLLGGGEILVPAQVAGFAWHDLPVGPFVRCAPSNGLSSGNVREEAICQGLCELIERDAWTMADIGGHLLPSVRARVVFPNVPYTGPDDFEIFLTMEPLDDLASCLFRKANLHPILHDITSDIGIATIIAAVVDDSIPGFPMVHCGAGTHPDSRVAVRRALTEAAQSRCVDIQGVREDIVAAGSTTGDLDLHCRRVTRIHHNSWLLGKSQRQQRLDDVPSALHDDVQEDLEYVLVKLESRGISEVIVVDFTPSEVPYSVVRVIVPELEDASISGGPVARRAVEFWRENF
jgi:ribosomal protein S12 methylthiotransferase accessory factor